MFIKRTLVIAAALALFASAVGCGRHHCCRTGTVAYSPAYSNYCDPCR
jgi:hypothetical protein